MSLQLPYSVPLTRSWMGRSSVGSIRQLACRAATDPGQVRLPLAWLRRINQMGYPTVDQWDTFKRGMTRGWT